MTPSPLPGYVPMATSHCLSQDMTKLVVALTSSTRANSNASIAAGQPYNTMEYTCFNVNTGNRIVNIIAIYRPLDCNVMEFCNEFADLLENYINSSGELLLLEDFNMTINKSFDAESATFMDILDSFSMVNKVDKPTHRLSNTLDLIIHDALKHHSQNRGGQALL